MKKNYYKILPALLLAVSFLCAACSSHKQTTKYDDAVRIKPEKADSYSVNPATGKFRNGAVLRGEVQSIEYITTPDTCPVDEHTHFNTVGFVNFVDAESGKKAAVERIPIEDVQPVAAAMKLEKNSHDNLNYFENYNDPLLPKNLREVRVINTLNDTCSGGTCPCEKLNIGLPMFSLKCINRVYGRTFLEIKPAYSSYKTLNKFKVKTGYSDWSLDVAGGVRFGKDKRIGLGLLFSTGVDVFYSKDSTYRKRMSLNLYGRYDPLRRKKKVASGDASSLKNIDYIVYDTLKTKTADGCADSTYVISKIDPVKFSRNEEINEKKFREINVRPCPNPFIYGLFGMSIDKFSVDLIRMNCNDCKQSVKWSGADISLPLNFGFGAGLDFPIAKHCDLSADLGFRSISFGDKQIFTGYRFPVRERVNSLIFRLGITF